MLFKQFRPSLDERLAKRPGRISPVTKIFKSCFTDIPDTPENWYEHLCRTKNPRHLASTLLSDRQQFDDKVKILLAMPHSATLDLISMRWLECRLEEHGYHKLAQVLRWKMLFACDEDTKNRITAWSQKMVEADIEARWIIQRQTYIQEEIGALKRLNDTDLVTMPQLHAYEAELQRLYDCYLGNRKFIWKLEGDVPSGFFIRAFSPCRDNPHWYQSKWHRQDCAGRGGCCGRACGCCEKVGTHHGKKHSRRHCNSGCGCCIRSYGRLTSEYDMPSDMDDFPFDIDAYDSYYSTRRKGKAREAWMEHTGLYILLTICIIES